MISDECSNHRCWREATCNFFAHPSVQDSGQCICGLLMGFVMVVCIFSVPVGLMGIAMVLSGRYAVFTWRWWLWLASTWILDGFLLFLILVVCGIVGFLLCTCLYHRYHGCRWLVSSPDSCCAADAREREALLPVTIVPPGAPPTLGSINPSSSSSVT